MRCGVNIFLVCHLCLRVVVAKFEAEYVAKLVGDAVVVLRFNVAFVKLLFVLWQPSQWLVKDGLKRLACIAVPYAVVGHNHDFVRIA